MGVRLGHRLREEAAIGSAGPICDERVSNSDIAVASQRVGLIGQSRWTSVAHVMDERRRGAGDNGGVRLDRSGWMAAVQLLSDRLLRAEQLCIEGQQIGCRSVVRC